MYKVIVPIALIVLVGSVNPTQSPPEALQEPIVENTTQVQEAKEKPVTKQIKKLDPVKDNPKKCNLTTQWVWKDFTCHDKEKVVSVARSEATPINGNKQTWLKASGIPEKYWTYVDYIVTRESGWNPNAVNPNGGACGLGQQLPCGKWAGDWNDPVAALIAMNIYVQKYGGWAGAYNFWLANSWY